MSDYISRQAVKDTIRKNWVKYMPMELDINLAFVLGKINELPSADVVEVVRCKDCKYAANPSNNFHHCEYLAVWNSANNYCSYGERKVGEQDE